MSKSTTETERHSMRHAKDLHARIYYGMDFRRLSEETVICSDEAGITLLADDEWKLADFAFHVGDNPYFSFLPFYTPDTHSLANTLLCKKLFLIKMFAPNNKTGLPLRISTMHKLRQLLVKVCRYCANANIAAENVFSSFETFKTFQQSIPQTLNRDLVALVRTLNQLDSSQRGLTLDGKIFPYMQQVARSSRNEGQQTPIIPSRILLEKYNQYSTCLDDYIQNHYKIDIFLRRSLDNPYFAKDENTHFRELSRPSTEAQKIAHMRNPITFEQAITDLNLVDLCQRYKLVSAPSLLSFLSLAAHCAKNLIHLFTLMRDHEVTGLGKDCLEPVEGWNKTALYVIGVSTKQHSKAKPTKWITTDAILKPIDALTKINSILAPFSRHKDSLFLSTSIHPVSNGRKDAKAGHFKKRNLEYRLDPILITNEDILELETIDPLRNWRGDKKYQIGKPWRASSHQFRRSMAVFAAQSGLITLPSLKRLLTHLTRVMSQYYTKGCSAKNYYFALINPELAQELRKAKQEADGAMFIRDVYKSAERLYGARGRQLMQERNDSVWLNETQEEMQRQAKLGLRSHTESPLGICTSAEPCDKRAHGNYETCPGCSALVAKESVMEETINIMRFDLEQLDPESIEYRAEQQNLADFIQIRDRIIAKG
ncbi:integrase [Pseudomonas atacamensis]|uniref:integrase n=1 Tax=Pseudomonas atacamensis TaxID=2565368 RepID=UPI0030D05ECD